MAVTLTRSLCLSPSLSVCLCLSLSLPLSPGLSSATFESFIAALDAAVHHQLPFAPSYEYLPLVQQPHFSIVPTILAKEHTAGRLFIRSFFKDLTTKIMDMRQAWVDKLNQVAGWETSEGISGVIIGGTSGVGKTVFAAYMMKYIRSRQSPPVMVYHNLMDRVCYQIPPRAAAAARLRCTVSNLFPLELTDDLNMIYLVDVGASALDNPSQVRGFTVVFASPQAKAKDVVRDWAKQRNYIPTLYIPRWTEEELWICCQLVRPLLNDAVSSNLPGLRRNPLDQQSLQQHVATFGRVARPAFASDNLLQEMHRNLTNAIVACDLLHVGRLAKSTLEVQGEASSWLLHYEVDEKTFVITEVVFASPYVIQQIWHKSEEDRHVTLRAFLDMTANNPQFSGPRGDLFEPYAHWILQREGKYAVQRFPRALLSTPGSKQERELLQYLDLPASEQAVSLDSPQAITALQPEWYGLPNKSNFATIDSAKKPNLLFQMTVSSRHDVNIDGLITVVRALQARVPCRLYFVVPPDQFGSYAVGTLKGPTTPSGSTVQEKQQYEQKIRDELERVEYWVLQLYAAPTPPSTLTSSPSSSSTGVASASSVPTLSTATAMHFDPPASPVGQSPTTSSGRGKRRKTP